MTTTLARLTTDVNPSNFLFMAKEKEKEGTKRRRLNLYIPLDGGEDLMTKAHHFAIDEKTSINTIMFKALEEYLARHERKDQPKKK